MRQIYPVQGPDLPVTSKAVPGPVPDAVAYLATLFRTGADSADPHKRGHVRANMVSSADGAVTLEGRSGGLSGPADRMIFSVLRSVADLVLVGAGTARAERYRPVQPGEIWAGLRLDGAPAPPVAVVTSTLDLSGCERLLTVPPGGSQTILVTTSRAPAERKAALEGRARIVEAGSQRVDVGAAVGMLAGLGYRSILTEGGPTLLGQLTRAGLLDELCLTVSPVLAAGSAGRIVAAPPGPPAGAVTARLSLAHVLSHDDFLLCRYLAR